MAHSFWEIIRISDGSAQYSKNDRSVFKGSFRSTLRKNIMTRLVFFIAKGLFVTFKTLLWLK